MGIESAVWPALRWEDQIWRHETYAASVPPEIQELNPHIDHDVVLLAREAELELARLDGEVMHKNTPYRDILLCCEAVASSQIESVYATVFDAFVASLDDADHGDASEVAMNMRAVKLAADHSGWMRSETFQGVHRELMRIRHEFLPGDYRSEPVWITPRMNSRIQSQFYAPHPSRIPALMDDLAAYCQRYDIPPLMHIATAHAQLETIHPFTYGNGRTGRALVLTMLRQRGVVREMTPSLSVGLRADMNHYYQGLSAYRDGNITPLVAQFSMATLRTVANTRRFHSDMQTLEKVTRERVRPRRGSVRERLLHFALTHPAFTAETAADVAAVRESNVYRDLDSLREAGVLATHGRLGRSELWYVPEVFRIMHHFLTRFGRRTSPRMLS